MWMTDTRTVCGNILQAAVLLFCRRTVNHVVHAAVDTVRAPLCAIHHFLHGLQGVYRGSGAAAATTAAAVADTHSSDISKGL
jgi:hypothetical protein